MPFSTARQCTTRADCRDERRLATGLENGLCRNFWFPMRERNWKKLCYGAGQKSCNKSAPPTKKPPTVPSFQRGAKNMKYCSRSHPMVTFCGDAAKRRLRPRPSAPSPPSKSVSRQTLFKPKPIDSSSVRLAVVGSSKSRHRWRCPFSSQSPTIRELLEMSFVITTPRTPVPCPTQKYFR